VRLIVFDFDFDFDLDLDDFGRTKSAAYRRSLSAATISVTSTSNCHSASQLATPQLSSSSIFLIIHLPLLLRSGDLLAAESCLCSLAR